MRDRDADDGSERPGRPARGARARSSSGSTPLVIGVIAVGAIGIGIYAMSSGGAPVRPQPPKPPAAISRPANPTQSPGEEFIRRQQQANAQKAAPTEPKDLAFALIDGCKRQARPPARDPDGALAKLQAALGSWGGAYDAEIYYTMAIAVGEKGETQEVWRQKYDYYLKCKEKLDAGSSFAYDPLGNRKENLKTVIGVAKDKAGR